VVFVVTMIPKKLMTMFALFLVVGSAMPIMAETAEAAESLAIGTVDEALVMKSVEMVRRPDVYFGDYVAVEGRVFFACPTVHGAHFPEDCEAKIVNEWEDYSLKVRFADDRLERQVYDHVGYYGESYIIAEGRLLVDDNFTPFILADNVFLRGNTHPVSPPCICEEPRCDDLDRELNRTQDLMEVLIHYLERLFYFLGIEH